MRVGLDRPEVVDADHLDILAAGLGDGTQHVAADAAKPVDCDPNCHSISPLKAEILLKGPAVPTGRRTAERLTAVRPVLPGGDGKDGNLGSPFWGLGKPSAQAFQNCVNRGLGGNAEMLEKVLGWATFAESVHADEDAVMADHGIRAPAHGGLDR